MRDPLRVTVVGLNYSPEQSGIAPYSTGMASGLAARGHSVRVITAFPHYPQWRVQAGYSGWTMRDEVDGVPVARVRHYVPKRPTPVRRAVSELSFGVRAISRSWGNPDVVICVSPALLSSVLAIGRVRSARSTTPSVGLALQDLYSAGLAEVGAGGLAARLFTGVEGRAARAADGVLVIHDQFKSRVTGTLDVPPDRVRVVRNWTHLPSVEPFDRELVRKRLGWSARFVVLHAGAMGEKQELGNVVEAARLAGRRSSPVHFVLMGDGGQRPRLEALARGVQNVTFLDPMPTGEYLQAMHSADALLVNEGAGVREMAVPSKLTSYFSAGRPVLATTHPSSTTASEIAASGAGWRVDPGDPSALLNAVEALSRDEHQMTELGVRGPEYCRTVLSRDAAIDGYEAWLYELVGRGARREG